MEPVNPVTPANLMHCPAAAADASPATLVVASPATLGIVSSVTVADVNPATAANMSPMTVVIQSHIWRAQTLAVDIADNQTLHCAYIVISTMCCCCHEPYQGDPGS